MEKKSNSMLDGVRTVFVDLDDTLWWFTENSKVAFLHTYEEAAREHTMPPYNLFHDIYLERNNELWTLYHHGKIGKDYLVNERFRYALDKSGYDGDCDELGAWMNEEYLSFLATLPRLVPGARQLLQRLQEHGFEVNILSNGFKGVQLKKLQSAGIDGYINRLVLSDDCGITKPLRGIFDYALEVCHASADTTVMIGDDPDADIAGAHNAGWRTIYFNLKNKPIAAGIADHEVSTLDEIV